MQIFIYLKNENSFKKMGIGDLSCEKIKNRLKRCIVPKSHFEGRKSGYYFTKHTNHLGSKSTNYEVAPVNVILDDQDKSDDPDESDDPEESDAPEESDTPEESDESDDPDESDNPDESDDPEESDDPGSDSKGIMYSIPLYYSLLLILIMI